MSERGFRVEEDEQNYRELADRLSSLPGLVETLPDMERRVARMVAEGQRPYEIAMAEGISEQAVWEMVRSLANVTSGRATTRGYETSGLGADTDAGVTGGYGDTGFGSIGTEGGEPVTEEPEEGSEQE
ncbi:MAG TPA: helix-turn-helix transcriptional regulator [Chloroflexota bacterium]|nr:helix-turn-helix transcriptional regulator [Chloroflexota bacterium]